MPARGGVGCRYCYADVSSPNRISHEELGALVHRDVCPVTLAKERDAAIQRAETEAARATLAEQRVEALRETGDRLMMAFYGYHVLSGPPREQQFQAMRKAAEEFGAALAATVQPEPGAGESPAPPDLKSLPPATESTICGACGESGHWWCKPSRVLFKGRAVPPVYDSDFDLPLPDDIWGDEDAAPSPASDAADPEADG